MKKLLSLALALAMCLGLTIPAFAAGTVGNFTDVKTGDWFAEPVKWAVGKNITAGTSKTTFSPNQNCTVAQILTFLWRANGSPKPTESNPFSDVKSSDWYADAAVWAYEKGMVSGTAFVENAPCTRSMAVTYMWKAAGSPSAKAASFTDVSAGSEYASAVAWAVEQGVTAGTSATTFSPDSVCTRGQIVTFLYRGLESTAATPYAEANGLSFSKAKGYTIPAFTFLMDTSSRRPTSIDGLSITDVVDASYTIGNISVVEADVDGMVQLTIPYRINFTTTLTQDLSKFVGNFNWGWDCKSIGLFDYYTGIVLPSKYLSTSENKPTAASENAIDITYKDVTYSVSCMESVTQNVDKSAWVRKEGGNTSEQQAVVSMDATLTVYMPKEYDGLCLRLNMLGTTEYQDMLGTTEYQEDKEDSSEVTTLLEDVEDINNYALIRVSDLM